MAGSVINWLKKCNLQMQMTTSLENHHSHSYAENYNSNKSISVVRNMGGAVVRRTDRSSINLSVDT